MEIIRSLSKEFTDPLDRFRAWALSASTQTALQNALAAKSHRYLTNGAETCSIDYLMSMDHPKHVGFPVDMLGVDLNYKVLGKNPGQVSAEFLEEARARDNELDDELQTVLGARFCALKAFYPAGGHIGWHTNWNAPGYNIVFTYSPSGDGYWRHIDPTGKANGVPDPEKLVHIPDQKGWHCKVGYFGEKQELDRIKWHCAYTNEPRMTMSYVFHDKNIWENMVEEIREEA